MEELLGKTIARYRILALLGEGGMGAVFKAHDLTLQRDVAVKVMHPHFARQADFKERFLQEARVAARLDHPCIVQVFDFGQTNSTLYIVMKYIPGDNLSKMLDELQRQGKWIDLSEAVHLVRLVAEALHYAHQHDVLHRDIKPGNIMIEPVPCNGLPYRPVLTDLGLAKLVGSQSITQEGSSMGTPAYMSPEQALGQALDARSDVYSLGILLYEMAVGRPPFPARTLSDAIRYHTREVPPSPRSIQPALPEPLEKVILKALEKAPENRFQDASAFAKALESVLPTGERAAATLTALGSTVSLITQYQQSLSVSRGPSILQEFAAPADQDRDRVQILFKDKTTQTVTMKKEGLTIGRDADNDVIIREPGVSRHHARVDFDGVHYRVLDLDSTNGTVFDGTRLLPGIPQEWSSGEVLKIGESYLQLVGCEKKGTPSIFRTDGSRIDPAQIYTSPGGGNLGIFLEASQLTVNPGQSITLPVIVLNQGDIVDHVRITLDGLSEFWVKIQPVTLQLMPGIQQNVVLSIRPPKVTQSRAGRYSFTVRAASQAVQNQVAEAKGTLTLLPFIQFSSELRPQHIRAGNPARVTVRNQGNLQESFTLVWQDRSDELVFKPGQTRLNIPAGQESIAEFQAFPHHRNLVGGEHLCPITVQVCASQGEPQTHAGEVISRALLPAWILPALVILCLLVSAAGAFFYNRTLTLQAERATQTSVVQVALQVAVLRTASLAATETADSLHIALQTTAQSETGTSVALAATPVPSLTGTPLPTTTPTSTPEPTDTPTSSPSPTSSPTSTPSPPPDAVSLNCDGTYQRFKVSDAGSLGKTITIDNWNGSGWINTFTLSSGDPMERQFTEQTGLYSFGGCQKLVVIPLRIGRVLQLAIYAWNGTGLTQVFYKEEGYASWSKESNGLVFTTPLYLFNEPTCCPCYTQKIGYTWDGTKFIEGAAIKVPTFSGTPPADCGP